MEVIVTPTKRSHSMAFTPEEVRSKRRILELCKSPEVNYVTKSKALFTPKDIEIRKQVPDYVLRKITFDSDSDECLKINNRVTPSSIFESPPRIKRNGLPVTPGSSLSANKRGHSKGPKELGFKLVAVELGASSLTDPRLENLSGGVRLKTRGTTLPLAPTHSGRVYRKSTVKQSLPSKNNGDEEEELLHKILNDSSLFNFPQMLSPIRSPQKIVPSKPPVVPCLTDPRLERRNTLPLAPSYSGQGHRKSTAKQSLNNNDVEEEKQLQKILNDATLFDIPQMLSPIRSPQKPVRSNVISASDVVLTSELESLYEQFCAFEQSPAIQKKKPREISLRDIPKYLHIIKKIPRRGRVPT
ncbi:hypothetical protein Trydic_g12724 [Trypoxylus dichotomus]